MACCPSLTTWSGLLSPASWKARSMKNASSSLSSTRRKTLCRFSIARFQFDPKPAPARCVRFHPDGAAHSLDRLADDGKTNSAAFVLKVCGQALKHAEQLAAVLQRDADTVVFN